MPEDDLFKALSRFHREMLAPEMERVLSSVNAVDERLSSFRNETNANFDAVFKRLDRLETEYASLSAAVRVSKSG